jgi:phosphatidylglycerophosphate synthase
LQQYISTYLISPDGYLLALILFFLAGITDYFDGYLARKYNAVSQLGEILDPIADKILILFVLFGLGNKSFKLFDWFHWSNSYN